MWTMHTLPRRNLLVLQDQQRIRQGKGKLEDLKTLEEISQDDWDHAGYDHLRACGRCSLADQNALQKFRGEWKSTSRAGRRSDAVEAVGAH